MTKICESIKYMSHQEAAAIEKFIEMKMSLYPLSFLRKMKLLRRQYLDGSKIITEWDISIGEQNDS